MALQPGNYRFEVQASSPDGKWGETNIMEIEILPPLWLTWWAKTFYVLLTLCVIAVLIHLYLKKRKQQMERVNEERINRLFELRDEARHQFAQSVSIVPEKISTNKEEEILVEKLLKAIGENMDNIDYTVDQMASDIAMSRANLYKKTQQMLGITPNEFLRNVRLKHAASLLEQADMPVNQVSLTVGFQTARYFSQCFRQMFGVTPTEYRNGETPANI
jgi:AraC-like DNA-binding protein